jgi:hypothetical protein
MCFEIPGEGETGKGEREGAKWGGRSSMEVWGLKLGALGYKIVSGLRRMVRWWIRLAGRSMRVPVVRRKGGRAYMPSWCENLQMKLDSDEVRWVRGKESDMPCKRVVRLFRWFCFEGEWIRLELGSFCGVRGMKSSPRRVFLYIDANYSP